MIEHRTSDQLVHVCDCSTKDALVCKEHPDCRPSYCKLSHHEAVMLTMTNKADPVPSNERARFERWVQSGVYQAADRRVIECMWAAWEAACSAPETCEGLNEDYDRGWHVGYEAGKSQALNPGLPANALKANACQCDPNPSIGGSPPCPVHDGESKHER